MKEGIVIDLGKIAYKEALEIQEKYFNEQVNYNINPAGDAPPHKLLFCEHNHVYTLGKSGKDTNLLISEEHLKKIGAESYHTNRGGDITYHGPGQIVGYPILNLEKLKIGIRDYINKLEEVIIKTLEEYKILAGRIDGMTGVWLDIDKPHLSRKICAMGVKASRQATMHGFALNVNTDLNYFNYIVPCGIQGKAVTSIEKELGGKTEFIEVHEKIIRNFKEIFDIDFNW